MTRVEQNALSWSITPALLLTVATMFGCASHPQVSTRIETFPPSSQGTTVTWSNVNVVFNFAVPLPLNDLGNAPSNRFETSLGAAAIETGPDYIRRLTELIEVLSKSGLPESNLKEFLKSIAVTGAARPADDGVAQKARDGESYEKRMEIAQLAKVQQLIATSLALRLVRGDDSATNNTQSTFPVNNVSTVATNPVIVTNTIIVTNSPVVGPIWKFLGARKEPIAALEGIFKIAALLIGGFWAWRLYQRKREKYPRVKLSYRTQFWNISDEDRLLRVVLTLENTSDVLLRIEAGHTWVQQLKPWPNQEIIDFKTKTEVSDTPKPAPDEVRWPLVAEKTHSGRELEPKETDEIAMDFVIPRDFEEVLIHSFIDNPHKHYLAKWFHKKFARIRVPLPFMSMRLVPNWTPKPFGWHSSTTVSFAPEGTPSTQKLELKDISKNEPKKKDDWKL